jgi:hypothetical protein
MTQRIYDIENEKDYADLWDIVPDDVNKMVKGAYQTNLCDKNGRFVFTVPYRLIKINWHDKTEITRPIKEATEQDINKICYFWDDNEDYSKQIGLLTEIKTENSIFKYVMSESICFAHCRRLTKQEIEELI